MEAYVTTQPKSLKKVCGCNVLKSVTGVWSSPLSARLYPIAIKFKKQHVHIKENKKPSPPLQPLAAIMMISDRVHHTAMPPQRNSEIMDEFRVFWAGKRVECNYCHHEFVEHATAQKNYLIRCEQFSLRHRARYEQYRESVRVLRSGALGGKGEHPKTMSP
ncbi:hypothetical protein FN846DRAFT_982319 [Sphaerosporella brunnea]|uniref:Uncharacterized protein n=1 Tax=Sphaerosporella brunnea TaxID=1250544 RepID=A0A5J5ECA3_9PEZI|nr:hypothetical protein FN846DRAFT_982319 [Sphaerosporella brunnea]